MKILICIKQVPDTEAKPVLREDGTGFFYDNSRTAFRINRFDEYALEEALLLKDAQPDIIVDAVSAGTAAVVPSLRRALEMGADSAFLLAAGPDTPLQGTAAAHCIAAFAYSRGYDLIFTGVMSEDDMRGVTGPALGALLDYSWATSAVRQTPDVERGIIIVERELDAVTREHLTLRLPAVLTVQSGINRPRYPSLTNKLRAKALDIPEITVDMSRVHLTERTMAVRHSGSKGTGIIIEGNTREKADTLRSMLHGKSLL
ncbi:MAG TPA: electron transfer flavoprotein subunit beta/FixA family protein [Spirochaetota bacterium]|nr:electron transfer flavoprotein subunit beta/FixA family protein [Spirochaetota bacterium]